MSANSKRYNRHSSDANAIAFPFCFATIYTLTTRSLDFFYTPRIGCKYSVFCFIVEVVYNSFDTVFFIILESSWVREDCCIHCSPIIKLINDRAGRLPALARLCCTGWWTFHLRRSGESIVLVVLRIAQNNQPPLVALLSTLLSRKTGHKLRPLVRRNFTNHAPGSNLKWYCLILNLSFDQKRNLINSFWMHHMLAVPCDARRASEQRVRSGDLLTPLRPGWPARQAFGRSEMEMFARAGRAYCRTAPPAGSTRTTRSSTPVAAGAAAPRDRHSDVKQQ